MPTSTEALTTSPKQALELYEPDSSDIDGFDPSYLGEYDTSDADALVPSDEYTPTNADALKTPAPVYRS
jgi:hypothetical protein